MSNYETLKTSIQQVIKTNGNNEITGALLQQSLLAMIDSLGSQYLFAGIAKPSTNPGTPDQKIFYIASTPGIYSNFGGIELRENEVAVIKGSGGTWIKETTGCASQRAIDKFDFAIESILPWAVNSRGTTGTNTITVVDSTKGDYNLFIDNVVSYSRMLLNISSFKLRKKYDFEFYMYDNNDDPVTTLSIAANAYSDPDGASANPSWVSFECNPDVNNPGRFYGYFIRNNDSGKYLNFPVTSNTWITKGDNLKVRNSSVGSILNVQGSDLKPKYGSDNFVVSKGMFASNSLANGIGRQILFTDCVARITSRYVGDNGKWASSSTTASMFYKVKPGHYYRIVKFEGGTDAVSYSILTGIPSSPAAGDDVPFATGESKRFIVGLDEVDIKIPQDGNYLVLHQHLTNVYANLNVFEIDNILNDYVDISANEKRFGYNGEHIDLKPKQAKFNWFYNTFFQTGACQSCAFYKGYMFNLYPGSGGSFVKTFLLSNMDLGAYQVSLSNKPIEGANITIPNIISQDISHCNSANFSKNFYSPDDFFPILYVAYRNNENDRSFWVGYRITNLSFASNGSIASFNMSVVHTIYLPVQSESNGMAYVNIAIDYQTGDFWGYGRYVNDTQSEWYNKVTIVNFGNIGYNGSSETVLSDNDIKKMYRYEHPGLNAQDGYIHNDWLIYGQGTSNIYFNFVNIKNGVFTRIPLTDITGSTQEPEGCFVYKNTLIYLSSGGNGYMITF